MRNYLQKMLNFMVKLKLISMKKLIFIGLLCSFTILFSQAKNVHYTDFIDFTDRSGTKYSVMITSDAHGDDGRAESSVRVLYNTNGEEHLVEFYSDCYADKLSNGNTKVIFIAKKNTPIKIIKGKDVTYNADSFAYEIDKNTNKVTGYQYDTNNSDHTPITYRNPDLTTADRKRELDRFYFRAEPLYDLITAFYDSKIVEDTKPYSDAIGWFGSDGTAYQALVISYLNDTYLDSTVRVRYEKDGSIVIVEYQAKSELKSNSDGTIDVTITPKSKDVKTIKGSTSYLPDSFSYKLDSNDKFISGKQFDGNSSADMTLLKVSINLDYALKFYNENDEIIKKYFK